MARRTRNGAIRAFFSRLFPSQEAQFSPSGFESRAGPTGGFFTNARNFVLENPTMIYNAQSENDKVAWAMKLLSQHIIPGAAHDSSARVPPPRCHPGTRIKINERITTWFYDKYRQKVLLWLNGPAGVGKSAIIQTFAESIARSKCLGASVFFSRPNKRNDPQRVFITIAYQLAVRIEAYRVFIADQLALDPDLVNKEMGEQFRNFITEPFVEKKIGAGGEPWGILLDGLDELEGQRPQRDIIRLISTFVHKHPEVPLVWVIASRPELHISETFGEEEIMPSYWEEFIPIDSTEACEDVERFLRSSFETIRKDFPRSVPKDWPGEAKFLRLAGAASGLFVYASVLVRFVEDADYANPAARLDLVLSAIDRSKVALPEDQPFAHLDALYTQILLSIPPASWLITKRILGFVLCARNSEPTTSFELHSNNLKAMSVILNLEQDVIYASLNKCYSVLEIPPPKSSYSKSVIFFHASFADYLTNITRSKDFYISLDDAANEVNWCLSRVLQDFVKNFPIGAKFFHKWHWYCSRYHSKAPWKTPKTTKKTWNDNLYHDICNGSAHLVDGGLESFVSQQDWPECLDILVQLTVIDLRLPVGGSGLVGWVYRIWSEHPEELASRGFVHEVKLKELKFRHLDRQGMVPCYCEEDGPYVYPTSRMKLYTFVSMLESLQRQAPELEVRVFGRVPESRYAFFHYEHTLQDIKANSLGVEGKGYYIIPYPY